MSDGPNQDDDESLRTVESLAEIVSTIWRRRYRYVRKLGEGGTGRTLLVERVSDALPVCLKFLNFKTDLRTLEQECRADRATLDQILRNAEAAAKSSSTREVN